MTIFEKFKTKDIDELADWLDEYASFESAPWMKYFDESFCNKCESVFARIEPFDDEKQCAWCEVHNKCRYFQNMNDVPDPKQMIKIWLESENEFNKI